MGVCMCNSYCNFMSVCTCSMSRTPHAWSSESGHESPSQSAEENTSDETQSDAGGESSDGAESDCTGLRPVPCPVPAPTPDKKHVASACTPGKPPGSSVKVKHARQLERERKRRARLARKTLSDHKFYVSPSQRRADGACCPKGCCRPYEWTGAGGLLRSYVRGLSGGERREFVTCRMRQKRARGEDAGYGERLNSFYIETPDTVLESPLRLEAHQTDLQHVCERCFLWLLDNPSNCLIYQPTVSRREFTRDVCGGQRHALRFKPQKVLGMVTWLVALAALYMHDPTNNFIYLPFSDKKKVYKMYIDDKDEPAHAEHFTQGAVCESYFITTWRTHPDTKHIKIRRWLKFALCDKCVEFREARYDTRDPKKLAELDRREKLHHAFVRAERHFYMGKRAIAEGPNGPQQCLSCIIDGADQSSYGLPYHFVTTHATQGAWKVKTHLMGVLAHGRQAYGYTCIDNVKHGNNLTIQCLHQLLVDTWEREGQLPPTLYVQLDNTSKQCKGRYVLGFLGCLVEWGVFTEVVLSFLPVGHTHEDIDQFFSCVARYLRKHNARSRGEMLTCIANSYHTKLGRAPITDNIENAANISDWLDQNSFLHDTKKRTRKTRPQSGISKFHVFKFTRVQGVTVMQVKQWNSTAEQKDPWRALVESERYHTLFAKPPKVTDLQSVPAAQRKDVSAKVLTKWRATTDKDLAKVFAARDVPLDCQADLKRCQDMIEDRSPLAFDWDVSLYETCEAALHSSAPLLRPVPLHVVAPIAMDYTALAAVNVPQEDAASDCADLGFDEEFTIGDFVLCVPAPEPTEERPFTMGCVKSARITDKGGHEWVWMLWYERKDPNDCPYKGVYFAQKVRVRLVVTRACASQP